MEQRLIVVGAGMAGLNLALALGATPDLRVVLLERDGPTGDGPPQTAFATWRRPGVAHFRQSHIFHPRLLQLYRRHHPELLAELRAAGVRELTVEEALPGRLRPRYLPRPADRDGALLLSRRATFEAVLRRHVVRLPAVELVTGRHVTGVIVTHAGDRPQVIGVRTAAGDDATAPHGNVIGDVIVDASGRFTRFPRWLRAEGIEACEQAHVEVDTVYYTRHYRLRSGALEPSAFGRPVYGRREFLSCCVYPGDDGYFTVTLTCALDDHALRAALADPGRFQRACSQLTEIAPWVAPERAEPVSEIMAMARFHNHWRSYVAAGQPLVLGFFALGDALAHTNPAYGAGCAWAAHHAQILGQVLQATRDPTLRARWFDQRVRAEAHPHYARMAAKDRTPGHQPTSTKPMGLQALGRQLQPFARAALAIARRGDLGICLWSFRRRHMIEPPRFWRDALFLLWRSALFAARGGWSRAGIGMEHRPNRLRLLELLAAGGAGWMADPDRSPRGGFSVERPRSR